MSIRAAKHVPNPSSDCISYTHVLNSSNHPQGFPDAAELKESLIWAKYSFSASSKVVNPHHWGFFLQRSCSLLAMLCQTCTATASGVKHLYWLTKAHGVSRQRTCHSLFNFLSSSGNEDTDVKDHSHRVGLWGSRRGMRSLKPRTEVE